MAVRIASERVELNQDGVTLRWGDQVDVQPIRHKGAVDGELTPEKVAIYLSKYLVKSRTDTFGLDGIVKDPEAARRLGASPHVVRMMETIVRLAGRVEGLGKWVHTLGFRGHIQSKSRMFSIKLGAIQQERVEYRCRQADEDITLLIGEWEFASIGHLTEGDRHLVGAAGERAREVYIEWRTGGM